MAKTLMDAMRKARSLVSAQKLGEATRHIQTLLNGDGDGDDRRRRRDTETPTQKTVEHRASQGSEPRDAPQGNGLFAGLEEIQAQIGRSLANTPLGRLGAEIGLLNLGGFPKADRDAAQVPGTPGAFLDCGYSGPEGSLAYKLYVPSRVASGPRPLIVMLHGCTQNPDDFALGTRMNALAEAAGALVVYPQQAAGANPQRCWNWFSPAHQMRGSGEPAIIAAIVGAVAEDHAVDRRRVFAAGLSAGGAMAAILGATYPDVFAAVGVHSGLPYGAATDVMSALQVMRNGREKGAPPKVGGPLAPMIVFHGDRDQTVHPANGDRLAQALGDPVRKPSVKKGTMNGRAYQRTVLALDARPNALEYWQVEGLGHAWSGGGEQGSYTDPLGPDASREMLRFFLDGRNG